HVNRTQEPSWSAIRSPRGEEREDLGSLSIPATVVRYVQDALRPGKPTLERVPSCPDETWFDGRRVHTLNHARELLVRLEAHNREDARGSFPSVRNETPAKLWDGWNCCSFSEALSEGVESRLVIGDRRSNGMTQDLGRGAATVPEVLHLDVEHVSPPAPLRPAQPLPCPA